MPVYSLYKSVGSLSFYSLSVLRDCLGTTTQMKRAKRGMKKPMATQRVGIGEQSLKKQIIRPKTAQAATPAVPLPTPKNKPS